jgi:hypothetical protein
MPDTMHAAGFNPCNQEAHTNEHLQYTPYSRSETNVHGIDDRAKKKKKIDAQTGA